MSKWGFSGVLAACCVLGLAGCDATAGTGAADADTGEAASETAEAGAGVTADREPGATAPGGPETQATSNGGAVSLTADNTTIQFVGTKDDGKHDGGFRDLEGTMQLNGDTVQAIAVTVKTESLWADNPRLEGHLKNADFFEVQAHPELSFASTRIEPAASGESTHTITGDLTMLDQTHSIEVPATVQVSADKAQLNSTFTVDRTQWGMNYRPDQVHKDVQITVTIDAAR